MKTRIAALAVALGLGIAFTAQAKLPAPPPLDEKGKAALEEKKKKAAEAADMGKAAEAAAEERAIKNYHANLKKAGKSIPMATPVVAPAKPATKAPSKKS